MKRAIISVSDKLGVVELAQELARLDYEIISTGGTNAILQNAGIAVRNISDVTDFPECLDGRLKTLHPKIHGGILAMRDDDEHMRQCAELDIDMIDLVIVNLYPFKQTILRENVSLADAIENIDIGGPTMIRAAAKNYKDVAVVVDPADYVRVLAEIKDLGEVSQATKFELCAKVFAHTAHYDALIAKYVAEQAGVPVLGETLTLTYERVQDMRYGENPHQSAAFYKEIGNTTGMLTDIVQLHGKELSFNNINDTHGALELLKEYDEPAVVACKHSNPCGVGSADTIYDAYMKAYKSDPMSVFGGIVVCNRKVDEATAMEMSKIFLEIILAPSFTDEAFEVLSKKKNLRILQLTDIARKQPDDTLDLKKVSGGLLVQNIDNVLLPEGKDLQVVTERAPSAKEMEDLLFTWKIVKYVKSNGIALGKDKQSIGIGPGQVNRFWPTKQSIEHATETLGAESLQNAVLASDAYFPFADCVEAAAAAGITAIIQPGGSVNDQASIDACNAHGIAMVFTGMRHFRH